MDVDFMITDTLEQLRPQLSILSSYEEANEAVDRMLLEQLKSVQGADGSKLQEDGFEDSEGSESSSDEDEDDAILNDDDDEMNNSDTNENINDNNEEEDDVVVLKKKRDEQQSREDEEDFEREFSKMMSESIESRKFEKKAAMLDVPIPMNLRGSQGN
jgi:regulator of nonsense transcripts 2